MKFTNYINYELTRDEINDAIRKFVLDKAGITDENVSVSVHFEQGCTDPYEDIVQDVVKAYGSIDL